VFYARGLLIFPSIRRSLQSVLHQCLLAHDRLRVETLVRQLLYISHHRRSLYPLRKQMSKRAQGQSPPRPMQKRDFTSRTQKT